MAKGFEKAGWFTTATARHTCHYISHVYIYIYIFKLRYIHHHISYTLHTQHLFVDVPFFLFIHNPPAWGWDTVTPQAVDHSHAQRFQRRHRVALRGATAICQGRRRVDEGGISMGKIPSGEGTGSHFPRNQKKKPTQIFGTKNKQTKITLKKAYVCVILIFVNWIYICLSQTNWNSWNSPKVGTPPKVTRCLKIMGKMGSKISKD